jgi:hypothetical protein
VQFVKLPSEWLRLTKDKGIIELDALFFLLKELVTELHECCFE